MTVLIGLGLPITAFAVVGRAESDLAMGVRYEELFQALRAPTAYRIQMLFDALVWLFNGGLFLVFAGVLSFRAPRRSTFIAALGVAQLAGVIAGLLRLNANTELASRYAAVTAGQQEVVLHAFLSVERIIATLFQSGNLLQGTGFVLVAWAVFSVPGFPRWLATWIALPGLLHITQFIVVATGVPTTTNPPPVVLGIVLVQVPLLMAITIALWSPAPALRSAVVRGEVRAD